MPKFGLEQVQAPSVNTMSPLGQEQIAPDRIAIGSGHSHSYEIKFFVRGEVQSMHCFLWIPVQVWHVMSHSFLNREKEESALDTTRYSSFEERLMSVIWPVNSAPEVKVFS